MIPLRCKKTEWKFRRRGRACFVSRIPFTGIGLAPNDQSLYAMSESSSAVDSFDLNGNLLGS